MKYVIGLLLLMSSLFAEQDFLDLSTLDLQLSADCEPLETVAECVNVESGRFFQVEHDFVGNTIDPIRLTRFFDSGNSMESFLGLGVGTQFALLATEDQGAARHSYAMVSARDGFLVPYKCLYGQKIFTIDPRLIEKGFTNTNSEISGRTNFFNNRLELKGKRWQLTLGDGTVRCYEKFENGVSKSKRKEMGFPMRKVFLLKEEHKANGNKLIFEYCLHDEKPKLSKVITLNRLGHPINHLRFEYADGICLGRSSCDQILGYVQPPMQCSFGDFSGIKHVLASANTTQNPKTEYQVTYEKGARPRICSITKPDGRSLFINYYKREGHPVESILEPLGDNGALVPTYHFIYGEQTTKVRNALGQLTNYHFDDCKRLSRKDYYNGDDIAKQECFTWDSRGWLKSKSIQIYSDMYQLQSYVYDEKGNVLKKIVFGNITGEKPDDFTTENKYSTDAFFIDHVYDDQNRLISKTYPQGLTITYDYLPGTNLCTKELRYHSGSVYQRLFRSYDENGELVSIVEDDYVDVDPNTKSVTYRREKQISAEENRQLASYGKPKTISDFYLDKSSGEMKLLKKIEITYDARGYEVSQKVYNSQNQFCYEITKEYDGKGKIIQESNPLGETTLYTYDQNGNLTQEHLVNSDKTIVYNYDRGNRLIEKIEHCGGKSFSTTYTLDLLGNILSEKDPYDNITSYTYDRFGRQILVTKPSIAGVENPTIRRNYNILNHLASETDENGYTTQYSRNIYGKPTKIIHPNESIEHFTYYLTGLLKKHTKVDLTSTEYEYDPQGYLTKETQKDASGKTLKTEEYQYKGSLLICKTDSMSVVTKYDYDGAGRKIAEVCGTKVNRFEYDDLNRVTKIFHYLNDKQAQVEVYEYDWLNRVTSKSIENLEGKLFYKESYSYNIYGNQIQRTVWHSNNTQATYHIGYDSLGRLRCKEDPYGHRKNWTYDHQSRTILDPLGRKETEKDNALDLIEERKEFENEQLYSKTEYKYDGRGNLIQQIATVMANGITLRDYTVTKTYNFQGLLATESEGSKMTCYHYDSMGRLTIKHFPNNNELYYSYDGLGRLASMKSSDQTIFYTYVYDLNDNPIEITDNVSGNVLKRSYDCYNRLIKEELSPGIVIAYAYDNLDRITQLILPDNSSIRYEYDECFLTKIERFDVQNKLIYECECPEYDMCGRLLNHISKAGSIKRTYDLLGRNISIQTPIWEESLTKFDALGNLLEAIVDGKSQTYTYDRFDHLTKDEKTYEYDSLGNCLTKAGQSQQVNNLNQITHDGQSSVEYDDNGNLIKSSTGTYQYDALNRLICHTSSENVKTAFTYDAFNRCLSITDNSDSRKLLYQNDIEIGSIKDGKLDELRIIDTHNRELVHAIELQNKTFYPIQDHRYNIVSLRDGNGKLRQSYKYTAFDLKTEADPTIFNPWKFANRRNIAGLVLFQHRFYNPTLIRWLTPDPIGFKDGLNLYTYVRNNPFKFRDKDGRFFFVLTFATMTFGAGEITFSILAADALLIALETTLFMMKDDIDAMIDPSYHANTKGKKKKSPPKEKEEKPPYDGDKLGNDPTVKPGEDFEWRGKGKPETGQGSWYNPITEERLHPDLNHPAPIKPHWDYLGPKGEARLHIDGTWEWK